MHNRRAFLRTTAFGLGAGAWLGSPVQALPNRFVDRLRATIAGPVLLPGDDLYEQSRRVMSHNPTTDKRPAIIVGPTNADDVAAAVRFAQDHDLQLAVQSGGHDVLGESTVDQGILLHMGLMTAIQRDDRRVVVQPGVRAGALNAELGRAGLAVPLGCHPNVGVAGLTLGGGLGWLLGSMGVTCDHTTAFEVVLADGATVVASVENEPDLFWGLRGGGGNFGVVTRISYDARPLSEVARGFLIFSGAHLSSFMSVWDRFMRSAPRELVVELVLTRDPQPLINVTYCHAAPSSFDTAVVRPLLEAGPPLAVHQDVVPYPTLTNVPQELLQRFAPSSDPSAANTERFNYWRGASCRGWSEVAIEMLVESFATAPSGATIGIGHYMHGAATDVASAETALVRTPGVSSYFFNTNWVGGDDPERHIEWVEQAIDRQRAHASPTYVNYLSSNEPQAVADTYGSNYERLQGLKMRYDPSNVFRRNRNVRP